MNFYKKIIRNQETRFKILQILNFIPDKFMVKLQYLIKTGRKLDLKKKERFTEKIQWYKLFYRNPLMTKCVDKYSVREFIKEKGLEEILIPLLGVYEKGKDINFKELPQKFVLKTTNGSHTNILCKDKSKLNQIEIKEKLNFWMERSKKSKAGREWAYYDVDPKIICEEYLEDESNKYEAINDYKFICFNGKVEVIYVDLDRTNHQRRNFYDINWNIIDVTSDHPNYDERVLKPKKLKKMIEIAEILSKDFPQVRVDLYNLNGKIYFGELTFYMLSGYVTFKPDSFDYKLGKKFKIPNLV